MIGHCDGAGKFSKVDLVQDKHRWWADLLGSTELGYCAVKHVQMVEEIDGYQTEVSKWINGM